MPFVLELLMDAGSKSRLEKTRFYFLLTLLCVVLFLTVNSYLLLKGRGLIWRKDGISLYYAFFVYEGKLLRRIVRSLLSGAIPKVPLYSFFEGYGADTLITMSLFDPFNLLAAVFPTKYSEYGFYLVMLLRLVATAWSFSAYCFHRNKDASATLIGSLSYVTCGFVLRLALHRHPKFLYFPLWIPLMLIEADKVFEGKKGWKLSVLIAFAFSLTPMFTYMTCLMMLGYCLIKYFLTPRTRSIGDFFFLVWLFVARIFLGFALGAVAALPVVLELLSESRVTDMDVAVQALYSLKYYITLPSEIIGVSASSLTLYAGVVPWFMLSVFLVGWHRVSEGERKPWLVGLLTVLIGLLIPRVSSILNGFNYVTDRWMPIASFCLSYIVVLCVPALSELNTKEWKRACLLSSFTFSIASLESLLLGEWKPLFRIFPFLCVLVAMFYTKILDRKQQTSLLAFMILISAGIHMVEYSGPIGGNYADEFIGMGQAWETLAVNTAANAARQAKVETGYRFSQPSIFSTSNGALANEVMGIDYCVGIYAQPVNDFRIGLELANNRNIQRYSGNDGRLAIDLLSGAKYYVAKKSSAYRVPFSYERTDVAANGYYVYETSKALPIAFSYDNVISSQDYEALSPVERQEALLQGCVLDSIEGFNVVTPASAAKECEFTLQADEGILAEEGAFTTSKGGCSVTLKLNGLPNSETYFRITDLLFDGKSRYETADIFNQKYVRGLSEILDDALYNDPSAGSISIETRDGNRSLSFPLPGDHVWTGRDDWCFNLGYHEEPLDEIQITFGGRGTYTFSSIEVISQPVDSVIEKAEELQRSSASDIQIGNDRVSAVFSSSERASLAFFSIPYSEGWHATVDGEKAEILQANVGFMAVPYQGAGTHVVELRYFTPGLASGAGISIASLLLLVILVIRGKRENGASESEEIGRHARTDLAT